MDTGPDPDQYYSDQDPPIWCRSVQIRIHNTAKEEVRYIMQKDTILNFKDAVLKGWFLCAG